MNDCCATFTRRFNSPVSGPHSTPTAIHPLPYNDWHISLLMALMSWTPKLRNIVSQVLSPFKLRGERLGMAAGSRMNTPTHFLSKTKTTVRTSLWYPNPSAWLHMLFPSIWDLLFLTASPRNGGPQTILISWNKNSRQIPGATHIRRIASGEYERRALPISRSRNLKLEKSSLHTVLSSELSRRTCDGCRGSRHFYCIHKNSLCKSPTCLSIQFRSAHRLMAWAVRQRSVLLITHKRLNRSTSWRGASAGSIAILVRNHFLPNDMHIRRC